MAEIKLKAAIELFLSETKAEVYSIESIRRDARFKGRIHLGKVQLPAYKHGARWIVNSQDLENAINEHRLIVDNIENNTKDLKKGIIHGKNGDRIEIEGGHYDIKGGFRLVSYDYEYWRKKSYGTWYCNSCNLIAQTEHAKQECHNCRDWNGCGADCTLSGVYCEKCGASLKI